MATVIYYFMKEYVLVTFPVIAAINILLVPTLESVSIKVKLPAVAMETILMEQRRGVMEMNP